MRWLFCVVLVIGCASARDRRRVYIGTTVAAITGTALTVTGIVRETRDSCGGSCIQSSELMWSGGATLLFLAGTGAFFQYLTHAKDEPKPSVWNYVPVPQPKPRWPASTPTDPTGPAPPL
jgi:hypothetical protein